MALTRNPWVAIMNAVMNGRGLRLSADEVFALSMDGAIEACALNDMIEAKKVVDWKVANPRDYVEQCVNRDIER